MTVSELIADLDAKLILFKSEHVGLTLREKVLRLSDILRTSRKLNIATLQLDGITASAGRDRIRLYMIRHAGIALDAIELEVVSGISDYGRRIRELRVEDGYHIISGQRNDPDAGIALSENQYVLIRVEPDHTAARRWLLANRIRKEEGSARDRILRYLQMNVGQIITTEELAYVGKISAYARRIRELRTEEGFAVATRFTGRPDLRSGEYVLESEERVIEPHDRHVPMEVQREVFERDANTCQNCGWTREKWMKQDPRFLELHHFERHVVGGPNVTVNLVVLCNRCHDDLHTRRIQLLPPSD